LTNLNKKYLILIAGPTAVGKTDLAIQIAQHFRTCIISADSRQIFKEMSIGTAVPSNEQLLRVKHYMIQNHSIFENYNASSYEFEVLALLNQLFIHHDLVILTGGSGLYINALLYGIDDLPNILPEVRNYWQEFFELNGLSALQQKLLQIDPDYHQQVDLKNPKRILKALEVFSQTRNKYSSYLTNSSKIRNFSVIKIALNIDRNELYDRINSRVINMIESGLVDEVKSLIQYKFLTPLKTVGYKEIFDYLENHISLTEAIDLIQRNTRKYARKQITWFRRENSIQWFNPSETENIIHYINTQIQ